MGKMGRILAVAACLGLIAGCGRGDKFKGQTASQPGPWTLVPAASNPYVGTNRNSAALFSAWRLNSQTGALEFCTYDQGGIVVGTTVTPEKLACSAPVKPLEIDNN
jgi:hypothetical protein